MNDQTIDLSQATTAPEPVDIEKCAAQFIALRDLKKEMEDDHARRVAPLIAKLEELKTTFSSHMDALNVSNMKTSSGTVGFKSRATASLSDASAFWNYCVTQGNFDLIDKRANVTAVKDFVDANGVAPPGVNYGVYRDVSVTRPRGK
jgi:hypothetical protein